MRSHRTLTRSMNSGGPHQRSRFDGDFILIHELSDLGGWKEERSRTISASTPHSSLLSRGWTILLEVPVLTLLGMGLGHSLDKHDHANRVHGLFVDFFRSARGSREHGEASGTRRIWRRKQSNEDEVSANVYARVACSWESLYQGRRQGMKTTDLV